MDNPLNLNEEFLDLHLTLERGGRITPEQAVRLLDHDDVLTVAAMADAVALRKWNGRVCYGNPVRIHLRPFCDGPCALCAVDVDAVDPHTPEVHLVGSVEGRTLADVEGLLRRLRERLSDGWIQGLTAGALRTLAHGAGETLEYTAVRLQQAGLDALLGTHDEAFTRRGRCLLDDGMSDEDALAAHVAAHRAGLASIATLSYGPDEAAVHIVERMSALRETQRKSGGFAVFAPMPRDLNLGLRASETPSGYEDMRLCAVGRLFFDNIPHVRVPWLALGLKMGQVALSFGADDLGWAVLDPHVRAHSPSTMFSSLGEGELTRAVAAARRRAVRVDGAYRERPALVSAR